MGQVTFNLTAWRARYPEFATVADAQVTACFTEGTLYVSNSDSSPIVDLAIRAVILNQVTAHIVAMNFGVGGEAPSPLVGRIESAVEGSVNVKTAYAAAAGSRAWWDQTKYGAAAWQALLPYRTMRYMPGCQRRIWP